jgi:hypothetical protein
MNPHRVGIIAATICTPTVGSGIAALILVEYIVPLNMTLYNGSAADAPPNYSSIFVLAGYVLTALISYGIARDIAQRYQLKA